MSKFLNGVWAIGAAMTIADVPFDVMRLGTAAPGQVMWGEFVGVVVGFGWLTALLFDLMERSS